MTKSYSEFYSSFTATSQFKVIQQGVVQGRLYDVMVGKGTFSYVRGAFAANSSPNSQDPVLILRALHWLVGEGVASSREVQDCIGSLLAAQSSFLLGMDYISEFLDRYITNPWYPDHWLSIDCSALIKSIPEEVKNSFNESQIFYIKHFNSIHPEMALEVA